MTRATNYIIGLACALSTGTACVETMGIEEASADEVFDANLSGDEVEALSGQPYDFERRIWLDDTDSDSYPDVTELLEDTDPHDSGDFPGAEETTAQAGFPASTCRSGFQHGGARLCISKNVQNATTYRHAVKGCRRKRAHVCSYEDLTYLYYASTLDATYNPRSRWIGNMVGDDRVFCGNRSITFNNDPDITNFEGVCSKNNSRAYWCCHDDDV